MAKIGIRSVDKRGVEVERHGFLDFQRVCLPMRLVALREHCRRYGSEEQLASCESKDDHEALAYVLYQNGAPLPGAEVTMGVDEGFEPEHQKPKRGRKKLDQKA